MKAYLTTDHGDRSVLKLVENFDKPTPGEGEVVVKVAATALNFHDIFTRRGMPGIKINLPVIVGSDIAGTVSDCGNGVQESWLGKRVLIDPILRDKGGMIGETVHGGRAEYVLTPAKNLIEVPENVDLNHAAALPLAYGTAWRMMVTIGQVTSDDRVLVLGASGGVGAACVQIAKMKGAEVIACASSESKIARLKELGADHVVNYKKQSFLDGVKSIYGKPRLDGSGGVTFAVNFTGGDTMHETQRCVGLRGKILTCGATAGYDLDIDARFWWSYEHQMLGSNGWSREDLVTLLDLAAKKELLPIIDKILPLSETPEAERLLEDREVFGKILLTP